MCRLSSGSAEVKSGLVGQVGYPFGSQHRREGAKHAWQPQGRQNRHTVYDDLAQGTSAPWTAMIGTTTT
jgi:hypothetical protein